MRLDYVLALKIEDFLERRLQTQVFKSGLAKSIHHARVLIRQRHIQYVGSLLVYGGVLTLFKCWQANRQRAFLRRPTRLPKTHRLLCRLSLRWWPSWSCQAQACRRRRQARGGWRRRGRGVKASPTIRVVTSGLYHVLYCCTNTQKVIQSRDTSSSWSGDPRAPRAPLKLSLST